MAPEPVAGPEEWIVSALVVGQSPYEETATERAREMARALAAGDGFGQDLGVDLLRLRFELRTPPPPSRLELGRPCLHRLTTASADPTVAG
jgi:hypothetical protein